LLVLGTNGTVHSVPQSEQVTVVDSSLSFREPLISPEFLKERDVLFSRLEFLPSVFPSEYFDLYKSINREIKINWL
jgi:hypothetical protein